jgi:metallo-beta-lactamase class B
MAHAQGLPAGVTPEQLATDNKLFVTLASKGLHWEEPEEPVRIAGPVYFVGTKGLGAFLITTSEGHVLMNTGMPSSATMIEQSIRKLGLKPEDIKLMINGHAHADHAGAFAYFREKYGAKLAVMREDVAAMESGGRGDFKYADDLAYPAVKVDRVLRDGDTIRMGGVVLTAWLTPGHTRGATTWVANITIDGKPYLIVWPDGAGFNPGYRVAKDPSYPGITEDYRRTHHFLEMLKPDIWLAQHNEYYDLAGKRERARTEGIHAWMDPEGYRRFIAGKKIAFEQEVARELSPAKGDPEDTGNKRASADRSDTAVAVNAANFARAESDLYFSRFVKEGGLGKLRHRRAPASIDDQNVVRMNRDTLYSSGVFDLDAAPVTITLPDPQGRFMSMLVVSEDHYAMDVVYGPGRFTYDRGKVGTRYAAFLIRTLANAEDIKDIVEANRLQDAIQVEQASTGSFQIPTWDDESRTQTRDALSALGSLGTGDRRFGKRAEVDPIDHLIGTAIGWGGNPPSAAAYASFYPPKNDGKLVYKLTLREVPVDGFWSVSVYNAKGYFEQNALDAYSLNNLTAKRNKDGGVTIQFGGCGKTVANCLPTVAGWNYTVRMYRPRKELVDGSWKLPAAMPAE